MRWLFAIWVVLIAILLAMKLQVRVQWPAITADAQAPTATPTPTTPAMCSVTGNVVDAGGNPFVNGTITFNSLRIQVINGVAVNPTVVTTNTDTQGNIRAVSMPQGLAMQVTICPGTQQTSGCSAPFSVIIPFTQTANFGQLAQGTALTASGALQLTTLNVTGQITHPDGSIWSSTGLSNVATLSVTGASSLGSTTINSNPFTVGSATQQTDLTAGGTNAGFGPTQITSFVGIGSKGPQIQFITPTSPPATETNIGAILWGSPANPNGSLVGGASAGKVSASINVTTGGANAPAGGLQFGTALGDGTTALTRMEVSRDGSIFVPTYAQTGSVFTGPGSVNVSKGYYINGVAQGSAVVWTPTLYGSGGTPTLTYGTRYGRYVRIANTVLIDFSLSWSGLSGGSGNFDINPFPLTSSGVDSNGLFGGTCYQYGGMNTGGSYTQYSFRWLPNSTWFEMLASGNNIAATNVQIGHLSASGYVICEGWGLTAG